MIVVRTGVDIGQISDPTAIIVCEEEERTNEKHFLVRHLERLPLGTKYPAVVDRIVEVQNSLEIRSQRHAVLDDENGQGFRLELYVDSTGIGAAIVDELQHRGLRPTSCFFVSGDRRSERRGDIVSVGKSWMTGRLQVLLQSNRIHLPDSPEADALVKELMNYEVRVNEHATMQAGAFRTGTHDDLVTALALAVGADSPPSSFTITPYLGGPALGIEERRQRDLRRAGRNW